MAACPLLGPVSGLAWRRAPQIYVLFAVGCLGWRPTTRTAAVGMSTAVSLRDCQTNSKLMSARLKRTRSSPAGSYAGTKAHWLSERQPASTYMYSSGEGEGRSDVCATMTIVATLLALLLWSRPATGTTVWHALYWQRSSWVLAFTTCAMSHLSTASDRYRSLSRPPGCLQAGLGTLAIVILS